MHSLLLSAWCSAPLPKLLSTIFKASIHIAWFDTISNLANVLSSLFRTTEQFVSPLTLEDGAISLVNHCATKRHPKEKMSRLNFSLSYHHLVVKPTEMAFQQTPVKFFSYFQSRVLDRGLEVEKLLNARNGSVKIPMSFKRSINPITQ